MEQDIPISLSDNLVFHEIDDTTKQRLSIVRFTRRGLGVIQPLTIDVLQKVLEAAKWDNLSPIHTVQGRSFNMQREPISGLYDTIQISGIGFRLIVNYDPTMGVGSVPTGVPVLPPSTSNILEVMEGLHNSIDVLPSGFITHVRPNYRYAGGYTQQEAHAKDENMLIVEGWEDCPFLIPHIEGFGRYPKLKGDKGQVFFVVTSVPFGGVRYGDIANSAVKGQFDRNLAIDIMYHLLQSLGGALRYMHDQGFVHLQPHLGNCMYWNGKLFLTDFGTMKDIRHYGVKIYDIYIALRSAVSVMQYLIGKEFQLLERTEVLMRFQIDTELWEIFNTLLSKIVSGYTGEKITMGIDPIDIANILNGIAFDGREPGLAIIALYSLLDEVIEDLDQL